MSDHFGQISIQHPASPPKRAPIKKRAPSRRKPKIRKSRSSGKLWVWALILGGFFVLYNIAGFWGVPYYVSTIFPKNVFEKTGLLFQTRNVKFNPLTFSFSLENSKVIFPNENPSELLVIKSIKGKLAPLPLLRNDLVSNSLTIAGLEAHIIRKGDGTYNFSSLLRSSNKDNSPEIMGFSDLPFHFSLNNIAISTSKILFSDIPAKKEHRIENIQLALPTLSNFPFQADNYIRPHFSATINGSPLELTGQAHVGETGDEQRDTNLSLDIQSIDLPFYFGYLPFDLPLDFIGGKAAGKIGLNFSPKGEKGRKLAISFDLKIDEAKLSTRDNSLKLAAPLASLNGTFHPVSKHIHLQTVSLNNPVIFSFGKSFPHNVHRLFGLTTADTKNTKSTTVETVSTPATHTDIDLLIVDSGVLQLFTKKDSKKPHTRWNNLQLNLKQYSSVDKEGKDRKAGFFRLSGEQEGTSSSFSWQGELTAPNLLDGHLNINNMQIGDFFRSLDIQPFLSSKGIADLKGRLFFTVPGSATTSSSYRLEDATISLQNYLMKEGKAAVLQAPLVNISDFSSSEEKTDFGNISIKNGTLNITRGKFPKSFSLFTEKKNKYQLQSINFDGTTTFSTGKTDGSKLFFPHFSLEAKELVSTKKSKTNISIIAKTAKGGSLKGEGTLMLSPFQGSLKTKFDRLQPKALFSWFSNSSFLTNIAGNLSGEGKFTFPQIGFTGQLNLSQASVIVGKSTNIKWHKGLFHDINFSTSPPRLTMGLAEIEAPSFAWSITAGDNSPMENFADILQKSPSFNLKEVTVKNGRIAVSDQRMNPVWQGELNNFAGNITGIKSSDISGKSQFTFTGTLDDSPFTVKAQSNLFSKEKNGSATFTLTDFPIADFHEQLAPQLDIDTSKGSFGVKLDNHWEDGQLNSSGTITFSGVEPESQTSESALVLALLTNKNQIFTFELSRALKTPVSRSMLFDTIIARFQKLIVKSSVSPILLANGDFTDLIGSEFAEFEAGQAKISKKGLKTLALYSALLANSPNIGLAISGGYNQPVDKTALKSQLEATELKRVEIENKRRFKIWQKQKNDYNDKVEQKQKKMAQEGKIVEQDIPPEFLLEFIPTQPQQITVAETMLADLAEKRGAVVSQYFTTQPAIDPERVTIVEWGDLSPPNDGPSNVVAIRIVPFGSR